VPASSPSALRKALARWSAPLALAAPAFALMSGAAAPPALACGQDNFYGHVCFVPYAGGCPTGYTEADGRLLQINASGDTQRLFALIGTAFGGDGRTTFALPDLRGRSPIGAGVRNGTAYPTGATAGQETVTLGMQHVPAHGHAIYQIDATGPMFASTNYVRGRQASPEGNTIGSSAIVSPEPFQSQSLDALRSEGKLAYTAPVPVTIQPGSSITIEPNTTARSPTPVPTVPPQTALVACVATSNAEFPNRN
jgi:microcystin-dependent protein